MSLAVINNGLFKWAKGYGVAEAGGGRKVTTETLFQAASVSKPVAAMAALRLVQEGKVGLDDDVNTHLRSWKVPPSPAANGKPITLRELLSHSAGLNVHGFGGYPAEAPRPTLHQVLDGQPPANYAADPRRGGAGDQDAVFRRRLLRGPAAGRRHHRPTVPGGDEELVLDPIGMTASTYEQPIPAARRPRPPGRHGGDGSPISGHWHVYPEMAA